LTAALGILLSVLAVSAGYGKKRTKEALRAELETGFGYYNKAQQKILQSKLDDAKRKAARVQDGIDVIRNVYAARPEFKEEYQKRRLYNKEQFDKLTRTQYDPEKTVTGNKPVSKDDFAALAMFAAMGTGNGIQAFERNNRKKFGPAIESLQKEGYSPETAQMLVAKGGVGLYSLDVLRGEGRMSGHFDIGMNSGREAAEEALKAYPKDKTKLAGILVNVVRETGEQVGSATVHSTEYVGVQGMARLGVDLLGLMEGDQELKAMVKEKYEKEESTFCREVNEQVQKYVPEQKEALRPISFEESVQNIRNFVKYSHIQQAGLEARKKLTQACADDRDLPSGEKKSCIKDMLKAQMTEALYDKEQKARSTILSDTGVNKGKLAMESYKKALEDKVPVQPEDDEDLKKAPTVPVEQQISPMVPRLVIPSLEIRSIEKAPVISLMSSKKEMDKLDKQAERIMEEDRLAELDPTSLLQKFTSSGPVTATYAGENMILRAAKLAEGPREQKGPAVPREVQKEENREQEGPGIQPTV